MSLTGLTLFISYAREDESYREELEKHLAALRREGLIEEWHDRKIAAGQDWEREIHANLDRSHIIALLISPDFMASSYCNEVEVTRAMQRHKMGTARVIPVLIRPADWQRAPFSKLQAIPTDARPVSEWEGRDAAFLNVVQHLRKVCDEIAATPGNAANPYVLGEVGDWYEAEVVIDVLETNETKLASMRLALVDKDDKEALIRMTTESDDLGGDERELRIPLDRPLEDIMGSVLGPVSEQIPANAILECRQTGGGAENLFIGGKTYSTTWIEVETEVRVGRERTIQKSKRWMSPEIPLDGMVKMSSEIPGLIRQTAVVIGYGRGDQRVAAISRDVATPKMPEPVARSQSPSMTQVLDRARDIIAEQMGASKAVIRPETNLIWELNADTLDIAELVMEFEDEFDVSIPESQEDKLATVKDWVTYIMQRLQG